jgi:superfamily I DNA/RNA helicase
LTRIVHTCRYVIESDKQNRMALNTMAYAVCSCPPRSRIYGFIIYFVARSSLEFAWGRPLAVRELERPEVFEQVHSPLRHLMVDEYQDINPAQERFIELLATPPVELCVVGDDDQSIYQWCGTDVENIVKFAERYPNVATCRISTNRRSVANIVDLANKFSKSIKGRLPKKMEAARPAADGAVSIWSGTTEQEEANRVAQTLSASRKTPCSWGPA